MSVEEHKELVRRWYEEGFYGDISIADEFFAPEWIRVHNDLERVEENMSTKRYKELTLIMREALPDGRWKVDRAFGEGNDLAVELTFSGTQTGMWFDNPPTGKTWKLTYHMFLKFESKKMVEMAWPSGTRRYENALIDGTLFKEQEELA